MVRGVCCVILAVLLSIVMCNPVKMKMNNEDAAVDEISKFEEGDLIADNKAFIINKSGSTKISLHDNARLWPGGRVPYKIFALDDDKEPYYLTMNAIDYINSYKCVNFVQEDNPNGDYINIVLGDSLSSHLGNQRNGEQTLTITRQDYWPPLGLNKGSIVHELMHSLGFGHEHNRPDRDDYVEVQWDNLNELHNEPYFQKYNTNGNFSTEDLLEYDFRSLMHATSHINSLAEDNNKAVIIGKKSEDLGQRAKLTNLDLDHLKRAYSCEICTEDNNNDIFRYPGDCSQYYICDNGSPKNMSCNIGLHMHINVETPQNSYCDYPQYAKCSEFI